MNQKKAIIFDMDETLIDRKKAFILFCNQFIDQYSSTYPLEIDRKQLITYMIEIDANGYGGLHNFIPKLQKVWKLPLTSDDFIKERNAIFGKLSVPMPELHQVLSDLKRKYRLGMITNGYSTVQREKVKTVGIEDYFEEIIVSGDYEFEKPDQRIFLLACERLGLKVEEVFYVGDYYPNDIAGALGAGITPIWITKNPESQPEYRGLQISELKEIRSILL